MLSSVDTNENVTTAQKTAHKHRLLVAIASFGEKNIEYLKEIIRNYRSMSMEVDVVVFSNVPKNLGEGIKVMVGLPTKNPWSLPFAHKTYFLHNVERYDLFAYSEDDMGVTEENIQAFLRITPQLKTDEIAGFLRYECDSAGTRFLTDVHGPFRWKAESVKRRGVDTIAEYTNEHAGFYVLTQSQLRQVIASEGYLTEPYEGKFGMLETAATDPYTRCGLRKVICISALEDFLIHHLPNRYVGEYGLPLDKFREQIQTLRDIPGGLHPASVLCENQSRMRRLKWSKCYYEVPNEALLDKVPGDVKTILSVGCGWGAIEAKLKQRGATVTAMPLDSIIGMAAARLGIEVVYGKWDECLRILDGRRFDCVFMTNLLHLQPNPKTVLEQCSRFVQAGGTLMISGPNFGRLPLSIKRFFGAGDHGKLRSFGESGIQVAGPGKWAAQIKNFGLGSVTVKWLNHDFLPGRLGKLKVSLGSWTARDWILRARRQPVSSKHRSI